MQEHLETACSEDLNELQGELEMLVDNQLSGDLWIWEDSLPFQIWQLKIEAECMRLSLQTKSGTSSEAQRYRSTTKSLAAK